MFSLSEITSLFDLSRYLDRSLDSAKVSAKVLSQKVKSPTVCTAPIVTVRATSDLDLDLGGHWSLSAKN